MLVRVFVAFLFLAAWRSDARAVHTITVCGETCSSGEQCNLGNALSCASNPAVTLNSGADLDFKGYTITCNSCSSSSNAVLVTASSSTIEDTVGGGGVAGAWDTAINCQGNSSSIVRDVVIDGAEVGIGNCRKVEDVVVKNTSVVGIKNTAIGGTDFIKRSYIVATPTGIELAGSGAGLVDHNIFDTTTSDAIYTVGTTSASLTISSNTFFTEGGGELIDTGSTLPVTSGNVCGSPGVTVCGDCISAGDCEPVETHYVGP